MQNIKLLIYILAHMNEKRKAIFHLHRKNEGKSEAIGHIISGAYMERNDGMPVYDPQKAARVWQRVQSTQPEVSRPEENLKELIYNEWTAAATYGRLARQLPQKEGAILQRLSREEHGHGACLRGIYLLKTGEKCPVHTPEPGTEPVEATLRRCYGLEMRSLKEYEAKTGDPEYGHVYARLADQEREHCMALLGVLGSLGKK